MDAVLDEAALPPLLETFYGRVRADALIGPLFNDVVEDWPAHLARLADFWSSVMLTSGRYKGNPMALHLAHAPRLSAPMFARWLELWRATTLELLPPGPAQALQAKAARIAQSLQIALKLDGPYRSTPVFDAETLPAALRRAHATKAGVWGVIRVLEGRLLYRIEASGEEQILDPGRRGIIRPQELHHVEPLGPMRMQVDFYDHDPG